MKRAALAFTVILLGLLGGMLATGIADASRSASGTYSRPTGQPVVTGTSITSTAFNTYTADMATEMTDSLSRSNKGAMLAPLSLANGSQSAPALTFGTDSDTGCWRVGANDMACGAGNTKAIEWTASAVTIPLATTHSGTLAVTSTFSVNGGGFTGGGGFQYTGQGTATIDLTNLAAGTCFADTTATVAGATLGVPCFATANNGVPAAVQVYAWGSGSNAAKVRVCNVTTGAIGSDPASDTYNVRCLY